MYSNHNNYSVLTICVQCVPKTIRRYKSNGCTMAICQGWFWNNYTDFRDIFDSVLDAHCLNETL